MEEDKPIIEEIKVQEETHEEVPPQEEPPKEVVAIHDEQNPVEIEEGLKAAKEEQAGQSAKDWGKGPILQSKNYSSP